MIATATFIFLSALAFRSPETVWERDLSKVIQRSGTPLVTAIAFSSDGERLAVAFGSEILLLDGDGNVVKGPFNVPSCGEHLSWSPDGRVLLICGSLLRLQDSGSCDVGMLPPFAGTLNPPAFWLDAGHVVNRRAEVYDTHCKEVDRWPLSGTGGIVDTAPSRGVMLVSKTSGDIMRRQLQTTDRYIAEIESRRFRPWSPIRDPGTGDSILAPGANAFCAFDGPVGEHGLLCWDLITGKALPLSGEIEKYRMIQAAATSPIAIAEFRRRPWFAFESPPIVQDRAVWDLRSNRRIANWKPEVQLGGARGPQLVTRCAISPDGRFVAEGGDGKVRCLRLPTESKEHH